MLQVLRGVAIRGIRLSALSWLAEWLLYAEHRVLLFEVRRICFNRRILEGESGDVGFLHMSVGLRIENIR